jgi:ribulose-phosphate 3-epimerase
MPNKSDKEIQISPSIIATDLSTLGNRIGSFDLSAVDLIHIDVMDGGFVPNLTIGPGYIKSLMQHTRIPFDIHLMIENPEQSIERYLELKPRFVTIHYESTRFPIRLLNLIRNAGVSPGISLNPATPVASVFDTLEYADLILIMSVDPGFYGQPFIHSSLKRIEAAAGFISAHNLSNVVIQVDGGITKDNIGNAACAGARIMVAGKSAFENDAVNENCLALKSAAAQALTADK